MPPAACPYDDYRSLSTTCCGAFDITEIEVVKTNDATNAKDKSTRIVIFPGEENNTYRADLDADVAFATNNANAHSSSFRFDYLTNVGARRTSPYAPGRSRSLADSFDSTDEIVEGSNEMKLMRKVVEKQRQRPQCRYQQNGIVRQDSLSDTNSVNSNDVFISVEDSKEIEYLDVLDKTLDFTDHEYEVGDRDTHPNKQYPADQQQYHANLDDIIDHLCASPCGECAITTVDPMNDEIKKDGGYPRSVLRPPRYSSSSTLRRSSNGKIKYVGKSTESVKSLPEYNRGVCDSNSHSHHRRETTNGICTGIGIDTRNPSQRHSVRFQNVDIRNFKMTLGNHPSATTGPPVMLDGELAEPRHLARKVIPLEKYERTRPPRRKRRQLKLTLQQRHNILVKERGFSFEEVKGAWQEALNIRKQRKETLERGLTLMKWDEVWESTCRKFNRLVDSTI